jgi:hypothetical protein
MNPHPYAQVQTLVPLQPGIQRFHGRHDAQPGLYCPLGIIAVGLGPAEVDEQAVTQLLRDMALEALDHFG